MTLQWHFILSVSSINQAELQSLVSKCCLWPCCILFHEHIRTFFLISIYWFTCLLIVISIYFFFKSEPVCLCFSWLMKGVLPYHPVISFDWVFCKADFTHFMFLPVLIVLLQLYCHLKHAFSWVFFTFASLIILI